VIVAKLAGRKHFETTLVIALSAIVIASYTWSILQTSANGAAAYFSPFTRAWELALGALTAVTAPYVARFVHDHLAAALAWLGIAAIAYSAFTFNSGTAFPGSVAAIPVIGTAAVIAAGTSVPKFGAERLLRLKPLQWLGTVSYGLYLLHWPILTISAERTTHKLSVGHNLVLVAIALGASIVLYRLIESPIRHSRFLSRRPIVSLTLIPVGVGVTLSVIAFEEYRNYLPIHIF
jgi:peptidoglycan/LPS O-acetylase OafA/YrhL